MTLALMNAINLLKLSTELFPNSFTTWDILRDSYSAANKHAESIASCSTSLNQFLL
jgi:hypothetical protein